MSAGDTLTFLAIAAAIVAVLGAYTYDVAKLMILPPWLEVFPVHHEYTDWEWKIIRMSHAFTIHVENMIYVGQRMQESLAPMAEMFAGLGALIGTEDGINETE